MQNWQWRYDTANEALCAIMDNGIEQPLVFKKKHFRNDMPALCDFTLDDANLHSTLLEYQETQEGTAPSDFFLVALHGAAIARFGKALMAQSWHFQTNTLEEWPVNHLYCRLKSGFEEKSFIIVSQDHRSSLCMLLDDTFEIGANKVMKRFDVVRVLNDRLFSHPCHPVAETPNHWQELA
ncbi:hypothetical protein CWE15_02865 [Aliidiomarina taiwanensis]|uniref:Cell division protein ZapC n=1 Tax=Aliidiomarina taiwanensis TaxID=946228 RepID=A0A432X9Y6_9GAMM|nr:cell division protein ZapC domain-containing protein [Aliidiomarina taiwanensis]RUO44126.1 hypothetical protein CWE15_02865 [Aliidiomarina taiwanensis]